MLTRETFRGPWAGLPVAWDDDDTFDEKTYRADVARCCAAGVPGVYTGGTTGEFYAQEFEEFCAITDATIAECKQAGVPVMIGCTSTFTRGAIRRARYAQERGADAVQIALPFWMALTDDEIVQFYEEVAAAIPGMPISVYETTRAKRAIPLEVHRKLHDAIPAILMVKSNVDTLGRTEEGCPAISKLYNVFVGEDEIHRLGPYGAIGCCSSLVYMNPRFTLKMFDLLYAKEWDALKLMTDQVHRFFYEGLALLETPGLDSACDHLLGRCLGFLKMRLRCRGPYTSCTEADEARIRAWLEANTPELADMSGVAV
ncbi:MAG: dihydrodipicolinate synthase family protein [Armatimonadota bacterium]